MDADEPHNDDTDDTAATGGSGVATALPSSIFEGLRARREQMAKAAAPQLLLDVPGYAEGGGPSALVIRYRYPDAGQAAITKAITRAQSTDDDDAALRGNCDVLLAAAQTLLGRDGEGHLVDLSTGERIEPHDEVEQRTLFDRRLAEKLGLDVPDEIKGVGRYVLRHVFSPRAFATGVYDGDLALMTQGGRVITWLQDTTAAAAEDFAGES